MNGRRFVFAGQTTFVVLSSVRVVRLDVPHVLLGQFVDGLFDFATEKSIYLKPAEQTVSIFSHAIGGILNTGA